VRVGRWPRQRPCFEFAPRVQDAFASAAVDIVRRDVATPLVVPLGGVPRHEPCDLSLQLARLANNALKKLRIVRKMPISVPPSLVARPGSYDEDLLLATAATPL
jgi:hypothetical protein